MEEKRKNKRVDVKFLVECRSEKIWQHAQVMNISKGGLFIVADKIEPPGTNVELIFDFGKADKRKIQAKAIVMWNRINSCQDNSGETLPSGMGVQFIKVFPKDAESFLEEIINQWENNG